MIIYIILLRQRTLRVIHYSPSASARFGTRKGRGCAIFCIKVREIIQCRSPARSLTPGVRVAAKNASFAYPLLALLITHDGEKSFLPYTRSLYDSAKRCVSSTTLLHFMQIVLDKFYTVKALLVDDNNLSSKLFLSPLLSLSFLCFVQERLTADYISMSYSKFFTTLKLLLNSIQCIFLSMTFLSNYEIIYLILLEKNKNIIKK